MRPNNRWVIVLCLALGLVLAVLRLPEGLPLWLAHLRPAWLVLVVLYWVMALPHRVGVATAWTSGLLLDVLFGWPLGLHAATLALLAWLVLGNYKRLRMYSLLQQGLLVFVVVLAVTSVHVWVLGLTRAAGWSPWLLATALASALAWPPVYLLLRGLRRRFAVH